MTKRFYPFALTGFCMFAASLGICTGLILNAFNVDASNLPVAQFIVANFIGCFLAIASIPKLTRVAEHICKAYEPKYSRNKANDS